MFKKQFEHLGFTLRESKDLIEVYKGEELVYEVTSNYKSGLYDIKFIDSDELTKGDVFSTSILLSDYLKSKTNWELGDNWY